MFKPIRREAMPIRKRSSTVILATEELTVRYDKLDRQAFGEVLSMSGFISTPNRRVPLVDVDRSTVRNVVGSVTNIRVDRGRLLGELSWARGQRARDTEAKYNDGHIDHVEVEVKPVELQLDLSGKRFDGEVRVIRKWSIIVAILRPARESIFT